MGEEKGVEIADSEAKKEGRKAWKERSDKAESKHFLLLRTKIRREVG